jgi:flagellin-specific chaperone FliS
MNKKFSNGVELNTKKHNIEERVDLKHIKSLEEDWFEKYFHPVTLFVGTQNVIQQIFYHYRPRPNNTLRILVSTGRVNQAANDNEYTYYWPRGTIGHFKSRLPRSVWLNRQASALAVNRNNVNYKNVTNPEFNSYDHYQINGSHQFCQTYALMYLLGKCRYKKDAKLKMNNKDDFQKFYEYTEKAIDFLDEVFNGPNSVKFNFNNLSEANKKNSIAELNNVKKCIKVLKKYPYLCLNGADTNIDQVLTSPKTKDEYKIV